ncbi:MAG: c-type cytochrome [Herpetosiphon sp.]
MHTHTLLFERWRHLVTFIVAILVIGACAPLNLNSSTPAKLVPKDPAKDPLPSDPHLADSVKLGANIFSHTSQYAGQFVGNSLSCTNCHINGGQKEGALPLVGVAAQFPEFSGRNGRLISLEDRIQSCFLRSENGTAPPYDSKELLAVAAYITWLSDGQATGKNPPWRGHNRIAQDHQIPIDQLHPEVGQQLFGQKCASCHGADGQGNGPIPPVWGPHSFNDGAGTGRIYGLAGFLRYAMPLSAPGSLSDDEAQQIAAFLDSQDRPAFGDKQHDYPDGKVPVDAVYYTQRYPHHPLRK